MLIIVIKGEKERMMNNELENSDKFCRERVIPKSPDIIAKIK
jgi:hypothetical protein